MHQTAVNSKKKSGAMEREGSVYFKKEGESTKEKVKGY